jgi:FtsP/CotA-like multicopper oxidase with cupredoxin domain
MAPMAAPPPAAGHRGPQSIAFNDNRVRAGTLNGGILSVALVVDTGDWRPLADHRGIPMLVFGEAGKPLQDPGPMIRVVRGTMVRVAIRNVTGARLVIHGLSARRGAVMDTIVVAAGATAHAAFRADVEGTYYYWGSSHGEDFEARDIDDAHLSGAFIVDPPGPVAPDRVFVIERFAADTLPNGQPDFYHDLFTFNGKPWPNTERLTYTLGDSVRWRIINASNDLHPLHLHGFFYRVNARGDVARDTVYWANQQRLAVTESVLDGTTADIAWHADRPGDWIFHCHLPPHVVPNTALGSDTEPTGPRVQHLVDGYPGHETMNHAMTGMGGLVLGVTIVAPNGWHSYTGPRRTIRLVVESDSSPADTARRFRYVVTTATGSAPLPQASAGIAPALILHRGEPTRIWVVNHSPEMTAVHWHGMELESYYDGVPGVSGDPKSLEPPIMPGDSFEVLMTPPRAGTFIYHTHFNDVRQLLHGLYGPLIVLDSAEQWTPSVDRVFMIGDNTTFLPVLNGSRTPDPLVLKAGTSYRFRFINISAFEPDAIATLLHDGVPIEWTAIAKDGAALTPWQRTTGDARQAINIGETFDFTVRSADTSSTVLDIHHFNGAPIARQVIRFVK